MKTIGRPTSFKIGLLLLPAIFAFIMVLVQHTFATWAEITIFTSFILYLAVLTYFCVRQKCYGQLIINYAIFLTWIVTYIATVHAG